MSEKEIRAMIIRSEIFGDAIRTGEATLQVKQVGASKFAVVAYLPAGIDLYPMVYGRFATLEEANTCFDSKRSIVAAMVQ